MRLFFPNGESTDQLIGQGDTSIGSALDNTLVLVGNGIQAHHAKLSVDARGFILTVLAPSARAHVNARAVREKAILRLGDVISIDTVRMVLKPDCDDSIRTRIPEEALIGSHRDDPMTTTAAIRNLPPKVVLRGVSGSYFGKIIPVRGRLLVGRDSDCDLILDESEMSLRQALIESSGDCIYLRDLGSTKGTYVNGVQVRDAILHTGDQIVFDRNRFLLEAPGLPLRNEDEFAHTEYSQSDITQTIRIVRASGENSSAANEESKSEMWWLIAAAALIGMGIALLLFVGL